VRQLLALRARYRAQNSPAKRLHGEHDDVPFLTTEKDAINLAGKLETFAPVHVVPVQMHLDNAEAVIDTLLGVIQRRNHGSA